MERIMGRVSGRWNLVRHREHAAGEGEEVAVLYLFVIIYIDRKDNRTAYFYLLWDGGVTQSVDAKRRGDTEGH